MLDLLNDGTIGNLMDLIVDVSKGKININDSGEVITNQPSSCFFNKKDLQYIWDNIHNKENNI